MENKPKINVKRFSRSKTETETETPIIEKPKRGRKKAIVETPIIEEEQIIEAPIIEELPEEIPETFEIDDDFLTDLNSSNYQKEKDQEKEKEEYSKNEKERIKQHKEQQREEDKNNKELEKQRRINEKEIKRMSNDSDLYSDSPTEIMGKDKLILLNKIKQYKNLFPEELKTFKIKPKATITELKLYIEEMDIIISTNSVDAFLTDSILQCIKLMEIPTSQTKNLNISGLSDMLKANKQFNQLCKKLYLRYNCFEAVPDEYQLIILVATTAYVCRNKNAKKSEIDIYLNEEIK